MFKPEFKVISANSFEEAKGKLEGYDVILVVGMKADLPSNIPLVREFVHNGMATLLSDILVDLITREEEKQS